MIECDVNGEPIISPESFRENNGISNFDAFKLGMSFFMAGEKTIRSWIEENLVMINSAGLDIQKMVIERWQKHFGAVPMPDGCLFVISNPVEEDDNG